MSRWAKRLPDTAEATDSLDAARRALWSNDLAAIRRALSVLPAGDEDTHLLRLSLESRLRQLEQVVVNERRATGAVCPTSPASTAPPSSARLGAPVVVLNGAHRLVVSEANHEDGEIFSIRVLAGVVDVQINRSHLASSLLRDASTDELHGAALLLLSAWATVEVEAGSERRRETLRDMRTDWCRVLTRLARKDSDE
jgi:hypothetical protein